MRDAPFVKMSLVTPIGLPTKELILQPELVAVLSSTLSAFIANHFADQTFVIPNGSFSIFAKAESVKALVFAFTDAKELNNATEERNCNFDSDLTEVWRHWPDEVVTMAFQTLKILAREVEGSESLMSKTGIKLLLQHSGILNPECCILKNDAKIEAMKCLVNCLHSNESCRAIFVELDGVDLTVSFLQTDIKSLEARFLAFRFLFLLSGHSSVYAEELFKREGFGAFLEKQLSPLATHLINKKPISGGIGNEITLCDEILKIVFNITMLRDETASGFVGIFGGGGVSKEDRLLQRTEEWKKKEEKVRGFELSVIVYFPPQKKLMQIIRILPILIDLITCVPINENDPLSAPHSFAINCLLNFPASPEFFLQWLPNENKDKIPATLCKFLMISLSLALPYNSNNSPPLDHIENSPADSKVADYSKKRADEIIPPLILVIKELAGSHEIIRHQLREILTPPDIDRTRKLDSTDTVTARLIKLMTSISLENTKNSVGEMLFALFDEDGWEIFCFCFSINQSSASSFTSYIGYGNAAGFLFQRGIMSNPSGTSSDSQRMASSSSFTNSESTTHDEYEIYDGSTLPKNNSESKEKGKEKAKPAINPITGEIIQENQSNEEWDRLSAAEKEYETHKLMEMLDKLNKNGVIKAVRKSDLEGQNEKYSQ
ncbi:hypothetical protein HK100_006795 [Physocladia obscura]|uniref:Uncharacterized protein n=1 Tax=Physocladia obscura TaxID=109957 RepID=A0AAD5XG21_9FUNG|nr:hypothetical protein HK100_006795 [Physocladia obscura]